MEKGTFGFILHPLSARRDAGRKYPIARYLPERWVEWGLKYLQPMVVSHITGIRSATGAEAEGWFVACPLTPRQLLKLPLEWVYERICQAGRLSAERGAKIVGLGAFTSVVGDGGITIAQRLPIAVTTGNSYTVATAVEGALLAAERVGIDPLSAVTAVIGATGSIGRTCALLLADQVTELILVGRDKERLRLVSREVEERGGRVSITTDLPQALRNADITITVTSAIDAIIQPQWLKTGSVICDVARPRDVSQQVARERPDVLVIEGGVVAVPGPVDFGFSFGFPPGTSYACMAETIILALEKRYENFTLGKEVTPEQVKEIHQLAQKHGFRLAGFRSFEKPVEEEQIERVRRARGRKSIPTISFP